VVRASFALWRSSYPLGEWAAKTFKTAYTLVSDFDPGHDAEEAFAKRFKDGGGVIVDSARVPLVNPDFATCMRRVKDAKPAASMVFIPAGKTATAMLKAIGDLGLAEASIKLIRPGDVTPDEELATHGRGRARRAHCIIFPPPPRAPPTGPWLRRGTASTPDVVAVGGWDGLGAIMHAIRAQQGKLDPDRRIALLKTYKAADGPRGPLSIDLETRDIVRDEYLREVRKIDGQFANVELETVASAVKDPWKEFNKK
jgi:branched-chain amino acid transport system substrate-binding protein